jgi:hypothetical protein
MYLDPLKMPDWQIAEAAEELMKPIQQVGAEPSWQKSTIGRFCPGWVIVLRLSTST